MPRRFYTFTHKDMYLGGRLDRPTILPLRVVVSKEKAVREPWELDEGAESRFMQYAGQSPYGHVYVSIPHESSLKHWPTFVADIREWLKVEPAGE